MKTLLVLAQHPEFANAGRAALSPEEYRVIQRISLEEAEPLLHRGLLGACLLDVESSNVQWVWVIEKLRRRVPHCPILVYTGSKQWEWEEEAYLLGVSHVLVKPVSARLLNALLEGTPAKALPAPAGPAQTLWPPLSPPPRAVENPQSAHPAPHTVFPPLPTSPHLPAL